MLVPHTPKSEAGVGRMNRLSSVQVVAGPCFHPIFSHTHALIYPTITHQWGPICDSEWGPHQSVSQPAVAAVNAATIECSGEGRMKGLLLYTRMPKIRTKPSILSPSIIPPNQNACIQHICVKTLSVYKQEGQMRGEWKLNEKTRCCGLL